jgi:spore coat protein U-like protein
MLTLTRVGGRTAGFILTAAAALAATPASAATTSTSLSVTATVTANCTVSSSTVAFGNVNPLGGNVDATGGITVTCTNGTGWSAAAGVGAGSGASYAARRMDDGGPNLLNYNLYTDSARSNVWGDGTGSTTLFSGTGTGLAQAVTVYGRVPTGQTTVPPGSYDDTVAVTVTY